MASILAKKEKLQDCLQDDYQKYVALLQRRFHYSKNTRLTKEEFDHELAKFLPPAAVKLHTDFVSSIFKKIDKSESHKSNVKKESKSNYPKTQPDEQEKKDDSEEEDDLDDSPQPSLRTLRFPLKLTDALPIVTLSEENECDPFLSDFPSPDRLHGRIFTIALEQNLEDIDDKCIDLAIDATRILLKNILLTVLSRRSGFKHIQNPSTEEKNEKRLKNPRVIPNLYPWYRPVFPSTSQSVTSSLVPVSDISRKRERSVSIEELYMTLRAHKYLIPNYSMYLVNMERIVQRLSQQSMEESLMRMQQKVQIKAWNEAREEQLKKDRYYDLLSTIS